MKYFYILIVAGWGIIKLSLFGNIGYCLYLWGAENVPLSNAMWGGFKGWLFAVLVGMIVVFIGEVGKELSKGGK